VINKIVKIFNKIINRKYYKYAKYDEYPYKNNDSNYSQLLCFVKNNDYIKTNITEEQEFVEFFTKKGWDIFGSGGTSEINGEKVLVLPMFCR
jgi:hypothetical protein